jgi:hypothetical protein
MKAIPQTEQSLLLRTDFSDDAAWTALCSAMQQEVGEFRAYVTTLNDPAFDGATAEQITALASEAGHTFVFVADRVALTHPEHAVLVVDLADEPGRTFRVIPSQAWAVENNLSISNMDFDEFADAVDGDNVFRGFRDA